MQKILAVTLVALLGLGLTGCREVEKNNREHERHAREMIQIGKECQDAGGVWEYDSFLGNWTCSFTLNKD